MGPASLQNLILFSKCTLSILWTVAEQREKTRENNPKSRLPVQVLYTEAVVEVEAIPP